MAKTKIGPRIGVDGEAQYREQIKQIIEQAKTLDAQMGAVTASFDKNTTAEEKAAKTSGILAQQLQTAEKRVDLLRDMVEKSAAATGENSEATLKWKQALYGAEEQANKLRVQNEETTETVEHMGDAMEEGAKKGEGLGDQVDSIAGKLGIRLPEGAKKALDGMQGMSSGSVAALAKVGAGVAVAVKAIKELYETAAESARKVDDLNTRAAKTGLDASLLQQLDYAQRFLDFENLDSSLVKLTQNMGKAKDGTEAQTEAFERLGVSVEGSDGELRNNWETFLDVIDALGRVENATERDTLANDIFGKGYSELKPLVDAGTDSLTAYMQKAEELGIVLDDTEREKLGKLADTLEDNEARWDALKDKLSLAVAPAFSTVIGVIDSAVTGLTKLAAAGETTNWGELAGLNNSEDMGFGTGVGGSVDFDARRKYVELYTEALKKDEEQRRACIQAAQAHQAAIEEAANTQKQATEQMQTDLSALADAYSAAYDQAHKSLDGQFSLWEEVAAVTATSTSDMISGLESQIGYWDQYAANFEALTGRNIEGIEELAARFTDGSSESAAALAGLKDASDEEIAAIIDKLQETEQAKEEMASRFAGLEVDLEGKLANIRGNFADTMAELGEDAGNVDFSVFEAEVDTAFSNLESRAAEAVSYVNALLESIPSQIDASGPYGYNIGYNAAGTEDWRGGVTWIGEAGPEKVYLPPHTKILSNQESMAGAGSINNYNITVENIQELDELLNWYESRQIRGRMK